MPFDKSKSSVVRNLTNYFEKMGQDFEAEIKGKVDRAKDLTGYYSQKAVDLSKISANIEMAKQMESKCALLVHWLQLLLGISSDSRKSIGDTENDTFTRYSELPRGIDQILKDKEFKYDGSSSIHDYLISKVEEKAIEDYIGGDKLKNDYNKLKKKTEISKFKSKIVVSGSSIEDANFKFKENKAKEKAKEEAIKSIETIFGADNVENAIKKRDDRIKNLKSELKTKEKKANDNTTERSDYEKLRKSLEDELKKAKEYVGKFSKDSISATGYATMAVRRAEACERDVRSGKKKSDEAAKESEDAFRLANNQAKKDLEDYRRVCVPLIDALIYFHRFLDKKVRVQPIDETIKELIGNIRENYPRGPYKEALDQKQKLQLEAERKYKSVLDEMKSSPLFLKMKKRAEEASSK